MSRARYLPRRALWPIVAEGFLSRLSFGIISFALPLFAHRLGMSLGEIGLLLSLNLAVAIALKIPFGWLADRIGLKSAFTAAIALRSIVSLLLVVASAPWQLYAIRTLHGVSIALRDPPTNALIAEIGGKKTVASSFAWYQTAKTLAGSLGRGATGVLLTVSGSRFSLVFGIAFALSALPLLAATRVHEPAPPAMRGPAPPAPDQEPEPPAPRQRLFRYASLGFLVTGTAYLVASLFPILAVEYAELSEAAAGSLYILAAVLSLSGPLWGWLSDHVSRPLVLAIRSVGNVGSSLLYLVAPGLIGFATGKALDDLGKAAFRPAWGAVMADVASDDPHHRARAMGALSASEDAGEVAGPIVGGLLWATGGVAALLLARIALAVATETYAVLLTRSTDRRPIKQKRPHALTGHPMHDDHHEQLDASTGAPGR
ncbi:MAG: MFS transporter [Acidimicrobiia bacterium]